MTAKAGVAEHTKVKSAYGFEVSRLGRLARRCLGGPFSSDTKDGYNGLAEYGAHMNSPIGHQLYSTKLHVSLLHPFNQQKNTYVPATLFPLILLPSSTLVTRVHCLIFFLTSVLLCRRNT